MSAQLPSLPLKVFSDNSTTAILDASGNDVVGWMGFDSSDRSRAEHEALARRIVQCVNAHDDLVAALQYIVERENFAFAECSEAEEIWSRARAALSRASGQKKGE